MSGAVREYTDNYALEIPNFDFPNWHTYYARNLKTLDSLVYLLTGISNIRGAWLNSTAYVVGDRVIDTDLSVAYECLVNHVSIATPSTFAQDRVAHSTYWRVADISPSSRGTWLTATVYYENEFVRKNNAYYVCKSRHTSGVFATDLSNGLWDLLIDMQDAYDQATAAAASAAAALVSENAAEADRVTVAADKAIVIADMGTVATDKATVAADKATVAADKATVASDKAAAAASATAASGSATSASGSATTATTQAGNAATSATAASGSATAAAASAVDAAAFVAAAAGGSRRVLGLVGINNAANPLTKMDFNCDVVTLRGSTGTVIIVENPGSITCNTGTNGVNGRDQAGAFAVSNFLHFYYTWESAALKTRVSLTAPSAGGPTVAAGTPWAYIGSVRWNGSSNLLSVYMRGNKLFYQSFGNGLAASGAPGAVNSETTVDLTTLVPTIALTMMIFSFLYNNQAASNTTELSVGTATSKYALYSLTVHPATGFSVCQVDGEIPAVQSLIYYWTASASSGTPAVQITVRGYSMPNGG